MTLHVGVCSVSANPGVMTDKQHVWNGKGKGRSHGVASEKGRHVCSGSLRPATRVMAKARAIFETRCAQRTYSVRETWQNRTTELAV